MVQTRRLFSLHERGRRESPPQVAPTGGCGGDRRGGPAGNTGARERPDGTGSAARQPNSRLVHACRRTGPAAQADPAEQLPLPHRPVVRADLPPLRRRRLPRSRRHGRARGATARDDRTDHRDRAQVRRVRTEKPVRGERDHPADQSRPDPRRPPRGEQPQPRHRMGFRVAIRLVGLLRRGRRLADVGQALRFGPVEGHRHAARRSEPAHHRQRRLPHRHQR